MDLEKKMDISLDEIQNMKENFKELIQEKEKLEAMFNNAINGIIRIDLDGNFILLVL